MKRTKLMMLTLLSLAMLAMPSAATARVGFGIGVGSGGYYGPYGYGSSYGYGGGYGGYGGYGYGGPYGAPVYSRPLVMRVPRGGNPLVAGAHGYVDEGDYRNYRSTTGAFIGRVPLSSIPTGRW